MKDHILVNGYKHIAFTPPTFPEKEMIARSEAFYNYMDQRRSIRHFSDKPVPLSVIEHIVLTASSAPSGAHKQPWTFCVISNPEMKRKIRLAAEEEEKRNYTGRMNEQWVKDLLPLGTDEHKPFLETAPYLIIVFRRTYELIDEKRVNNYYINESVGIACGFLISAIHQAGLVTLTHTPSPMGFLTEVLERPSNERPFLLLPVGYPADEVYVPAIERKPLKEVMVHYD